MTDTKINDFNPGELNLIQITLAKRFVNVIDTDGRRYQIEKNTAEETH